MLAYAVMKFENDGSKKFLSAWPTEKQAKEHAAYCSYPVEVVPVEIEGISVTAAR